MISKERIADEHAKTGKIAEAATAAEEQMAFYLRRAFGSDPHIRVLNDLRLPLGGKDFVQIDHLVLDPFGIVLVESKSVAGSILINEHGEWCRIYGTKQTGMRSAIVQVRMQADGLRTFLGSAAQQFDSRSRAFVVGFPIDILVAISDQGIIDRRCLVPEVFKADGIPHAIQKIIEKRQMRQRASEIPARDQVIGETAAFLCRHHWPANRRAPQNRTPGSTMIAAKPIGSDSAAVSAPNKEKLCRTCGTSALHLQHGRYGYFFRCLHCTENTPINFGCKKCGFVKRG